LKGKIEFNGLNDENRREMPKVTNLRGVEEPS